MKKIGVDARLYFQTGVGTYLRNLIYHLQTKITQDYIFYIYLMKDDYPKINFGNKKLIKKVVPSIWHSLSEQLDFLRILSQDNLDLMHFTYFSYPIFYKKKFIATIHDITPLLFKTGKASTRNSLLYEIKHFFFRYILSSQVKNAEKVIVPCNTVKRQLTGYFGAEFGSKIKPIYEGIDYELTQSSENKSLAEVYKGDFFIYVGNFYPHKNVEKLIKAFAKINSDYKLVLLGPDDFFTKRMNQLINELSQDKRIILYKNPSFEDIVFFYKNAKALVHPSMSEGFGLPLIEAAYFHCPIIASDIAVFRELLGSNFLQFDPSDIKDIADKLQLFMSEPIVFDYKEINNKYSFEKMTKETLKVYNDILGRSS